MAWEEVARAQAGVKREAGAVVGKDLKRLMLYRSGLSTSDTVRLLIDKDAGLIGFAKGGPYKVCKGHISGNDTKVVNCSELIRDLKLQGGAFLPMALAEGVDFAVSYAPISKPAVIDRTPAPVSKVDQVRTGSARSYTDEQFEEAIRLFGEGKSAKQVQAIMGFSSWFVPRNMFARNRERIQELREANGGVRARTGPAPRAAEEEFIPPPTPGMREAAEKMDEILRPPTKHGPGITVAPPRSGDSHNGHSNGVPPPVKASDWPLGDISKRHCMEVVKEFSKPMGEKIDIPWLAANLGLRTAQVYLIRDQFAKDIEDLISLHGIERGDAITRIMARWKKTWPEGAAA